VSTPPDRARTVRPGSLIAGRARRLTAPAVRALRAVDRAVGRARGPRIVLVEARTPMNLAVLRPVLDELLEDRRLRLRFTGPLRDDLQHAFEEMGVSSRVVGRDRAEWSRVDLYINADPWEAASLRRVARQLNFFHGVAGKYDLDCPRNLPIGFDRYDRVAFPNESRLTSYVAAGIVTREQAALVGYPKADALAANHARPSDAARALGLEPARATVIYAPTFSPAASLQASGEAIVETMLAAGWNVIAKLHDRSFDPDPKYTGGIDWRARFGRFERTGRFVLAASGDSTPYVLASDAMITDHSSIGFEFCVLDRPLIVFDVPGLAEAARINPDKIALLRSAATVVRHVEDVASATASELAAPGRLSAARRHAANDVFYRPGRATDRALSLIYEMLDLPSPMSARQNVGLSSSSEPMNAGGERA
jgi:CDP-glycerol:poly(glycerophosphate) glycerophosphotransferase